MQVSECYNVKIYDLTIGKSLPDWLSDRKRRALQKKDIEIRRRIELLQDFDMPGISSTIRISPDGQYVMATGTYKPRVKCFDVSNLSMKFERCFDAEAVTFEILSEDYSKMVFLQSDRYVEFHSASGRHYRLRVPKFGRDMKYHYPTCDLFVVGAGSDIYRLNLERGQFMTPFTSTASSINRCTISPLHGLLICGTEEGIVEAWDPRSRNLVGTLDCAFSCINNNRNINNIPAISALQFKDALTMAVGTATGQVLLYDLRSKKPFYVKDHMTEDAIRDIEFHHQHNLVYSMDRSILKIWDQNNGKLFTTVQATADFNNLCVVPRSGLFFIANEQPKIKTYYIPSMGTAPRWASFLDSLTEELEESKSENVYDDYKFVTKDELTRLGLDDFIGTDMLKGAMHGYFIDVKLYMKAKSVSSSNEISELRKNKIKDEINKSRSTTKLPGSNARPKVNKDFASKLMNESNLDNEVILNDKRFENIFVTRAFEMDKNGDEYRLLNPVLSRVEELKKKSLKKKRIAEEFEPVDEKPEDKDNDSSESQPDDDSSDDDQKWTGEMKKQHKIIKREHRLNDRLEAEKNRNNRREPKLFALKQGEEFKGIHATRKSNKQSLQERLEEEHTNVQLLGSVGNREMTFSTHKSNKLKMIQARNREHREERKKVARPMKGFKF